MKQTAVLVLTLFCLGTLGLASSQITYFPYFAVGKGWRAVLMLVNDSDTPSAVRLFVAGSKGLGSFSGLKIDESESSGELLIELDPESTRRLVIDSTLHATELQTGFVKLVPEGSDSEFRASLFYEFREEDGEIFESIGIMPLTSVASPALVPIQRGSGKDTAVALLPEGLLGQSVGDPSIYLPAKVKLSLFNAEGELVDSKTIEISEIYSRFVSEIFEDVVIPEVGHLHIQPASMYGTSLVTALFFEWRTFGWELTALEPQGSRRSD